MSLLAAELGPPCLHPPCTSHPRGKLLAHVCITLRHSGIVGPWVAAWQEGWGAEQSSSGQASAAYAWGGNGVPPTARQPTLPASLLRPDEQRRPAAEHPALYRLLCAQSIPHCV